ncbi:MAG: yecA family protein [Pseudomonadales bacterium]|jgi:yecA family protein
MTDSLPALPEYDDVDDWFLSLEAEARPAELHGQLSGLIAGNGTPKPNQWLAICSQLLEVNIQPGTPIADELCALVGVVTQQFSVEGFGLELLVPDEQASMLERVEGLGQWCQGFLTGFALAGNTQQGWKDLSEESREVLTDLASIAQVMVDEDDAEQQEQDYLELLEYVRLGAIQVWLDLNPPPPRELDPATGAPYPPANDSVH